MRTILGGQAGLPEIRRMGRTPSIKRPIAEGEAVRLFVGALEGEAWLARPIATKKPRLGLLPGQSENGRWIDAVSATTPNHLRLLRALHDAWEAIPPQVDDLRRDLKPAIGLAMDSLLAECQALGVPPQGQALRDLLRHRTLFPTAPDPRPGAAILDSVTVIQELCHDGPKPKLGVAPDQLAALVGA